MKNIISIYLLIFLGLISFTSAYYCYQEDVNVPNQTGIDGTCTLSYTGSKNHTGGAYTADVRNVWDGNWATGSGEIYYQFYENYTVPVSSTDAILQFAIFVGSPKKYNVSLYPRHFVNSKIQIMQNESTVYELHVWNSSGVWEQMGFGSTRYVYETGIFWGMNPILNVTASSYMGSISSFNFTINGTTYSTNSGSLIVPIIENYSYSTLLDSSGYTNSYYNFTANSSNIQYKNFSLNPPYSINIFSFLESDKSVVNINASILFFGFSNSFTRVLNGTNATFYNISSDTYTITVSSSGYATRSYIATIDSTSQQTLNIYMLPINSSIDVGIYTKSLVDTILAGTVVQVQQLVNTSYLGVTQGLTDGSGYIALNLEEGKVYRFILSADNFNIFTTDITPYAINSPYTFKLSPSSTFTFHTVTDYVKYYYTPVSVVLNTTSSSNTTFTFTTYSANGSVQYTSITCLWGSSNISSSNVSGSPTGSTVSLSLPTPSDQEIVCRFEFSAIGYGYYGFDVNYRGVTESDSSLVASAKVVKNATQLVWLTLLSYIFMVIVAIGIKQKYPDVRITGVIFTVGAIFFISIGWIDWVAGGVSATIGLLLLYMGSR